MKRLALILVLLTWMPAYGAAIWEAIPEDAVIVVVAAQYNTGVRALRGYVDGCVPATLPAGHEQAGLPFLAELTQLREWLDKAQEEAGASPSEPVGLAVFASANGEAKTVLFEPVSEDAWRASNAASIRQTPGGAQVVRDGKRFFFRFNGAYLVSSRDAEAVSLYEKLCGRSLREDRCLNLGKLLESHEVAANVSVTTLVRAWKSRQATAADTIAAGISQRLKSCSSGTQILPLPEAFLSALIQDYISNGDEIYAGIDITDESIDFSGRVDIRKGGRYDAILREQEGGADEAYGLVPTSAAAAACVSLEGEVFWSHVRGFVGPYVGGTLKDPTALQNSLRLAQQVFDDFRGKVGLRRTAFALVCAEDGKYPVPAVVAQVDDTAAAVTSLSNAVLTLYGDVMLQSYARQEGMYLGVPAKEQSENGAAVKIPLSVSAADPVKAAKVRDILGTHMMWRMAALEEDDRRTVIAGQIAREESFRALCSDFPNNASGMFGESTSRAGNILFGAFVNLPLLVTARMKAAARLAGASTAAYQSLPVVPGCAISAYSTDEGIGFDGAIPIEQIRAAYTVLSKGGPVKTRKTSPGSDTEKSGETKGVGRRGGRGGFGRREDD